MRKVDFILSCTILINFLLGQTTIAVLQFDARGISNDEVATLTDRFRDELIKTDQFSVIERGMMEEVLKEQGFQQSGCFSDECVVEVGHLIGVQQMVGGSIGKVGNVFSVSARVIDVQSGEVLNVTNYDHTGELGLLLTKGMRNTVQQLLKGNIDQSAVAKESEGVNYKSLTDLQPEPTKGLSPEEAFVNAMVTIPQGRSTVKENGVKSNELTILSTFKQTGTITDIDGNVYKTVKIGDQWWMAENLEVIHYRNGDTIPNMPDLSDLGEWAGLIGSDFRNYGRLYNWYMANDSNNIAPEDWHVPSDVEWQTLVNFLGGRRNAGGRMKAIGTELWESPNTGATNESGFTGLPGGYIIEGGWPGGEGHYAYFWSSTETDSDNAWNRALTYNFSSVARGSSSKQARFSVRCVRD